jgi:hypothetical protein
MLSRQREAVELANYIHNQLAVLAFQLIGVSQKSNIKFYQLEQGNIVIDMHP